MNLSFEVESVGSCRFQIHLYILACVMSRKFTRDSVTKFLPAQFPWIWCKCLLQKNFNSFKDFQSDQIQTRSGKLFTAYYACSNSDLNLTLVTGTTNEFIFQIIKSLTESWGVRLTCFDCNLFLYKEQMYRFYSLCPAILHNYVLWIITESKWSPLDNINNCFGPTCPRGHSTTCWGQLQTLLQ